MDDKEQKVCKEIVKLVNYYVWGSRGMITLSSGGGYKDPELIDTAKKVIEIIHNG